MYVEAEYHGGSGRAKGLTSWVFRWHKYRKERYMNNI
jgi:hypothetical protein